MIIIIAQRNPGVSSHEHGTRLLSHVINKLFPELKDYSIIRNENGKPSIKEKPEFHYNISHSRDWTAIAVANKEIGLDIQYIRPMKQGLEKRFFTRRENKHLELLPEEERISAAVKMWTMKEATVKAFGGSLAKYIKVLDTISYDGTWSPLMLERYVEDIPFPDENYIMSCAYCDLIKDNYNLTILK